MKRRWLTRCWLNLLILSLVVETLCRLNRTMTLRQILDKYDRSLSSEGPELTRQPTFDGDMPPVEDIIAGVTEELAVPGTKQLERQAARGFERRWHTFRSQSASCVSDHLSCRPHSMVKQVATRLKWIPQTTTADQGILADECSHPLIARPVARSWADIDDEENATWSIVMRSQQPVYTAEGCLSTESRIVKRHRQIAQIKLGYQYMIDHIVHPERLDRPDTPDHTLDISKREWESLRMKWWKYYEEKVAVPAQPAQPSTSVTEDIASEIVQG